MVLSVDRQGEPAAAAPRRHLWLGRCALLVLLLGSAGLIVAFPWKIWDPTVDQYFVVSTDLRIYREAGYWQFHYPMLQHSGGITACLTIGLYKLLVPTSAENINEHARVLSMILFCVAGFLLAEQHLHGWRSLLMFLLFLFSSRYPFLWHSAELMAGAFLCLFIYGLGRQWNIWVLSLLLVFFGLSKVELIGAAVLVLAAWLTMRASEKRRSAIVASLLSCVVVVFLPGLMVHGTRTVSGERAFISFGQHYSHRVSIHQAGEAPPKGWDEWRRYLERVYPGAKSMPEIVTRYPRKYLDFLALSACASILSFMVVLKGNLVALLARWISPTPRDLEPASYLLARTTAYAILGVVPVIPFAWFEVRYLARYYVPLLVLSLSSCEHSLSSRADTRRPATVAVAVALLFSLCWQFGEIWRLLSGLSLGAPYWFPGDLGVI